VVGFHQVSLENVTEKLHVALLKGVISVTFFSSQGGVFIIANGKWNSAFMLA